LVLRPRLIEKFTELLNQVSGSVKPMQIDYRPYIHLQIDSLI
jgi:hypothetical protein